LRCRARALLLACTRPFGYLVFVAAVAALSLASRLLGDDHELGFLCGRLNEMVRRYPEVTRRGVRTAWCVWIAAFAFAISPFDPIAGRWDAVVLCALAAGLLWRRVFRARRAGT